MNMKPKVTPKRGGGEFGTKASVPTKAGGKPKRSNGKSKVARKPKWRDPFGALDRPFEMYALAAPESLRLSSSSSSSSSSCILYYSEHLDYQSWNDSIHEGERYLVTNCEYGLQFGMEGTPAGYYCSYQDGIVSWDSLTEGTIAFITASCNPNDTKATVIPKVAITSTKLEEGKIVLKLTPPEATGTLSLKFKNSQTGDATDFIYKQQHAGGETTISVNQLLLDGKLDGYDLKVYHEAVAKWEVPGGDDPKTVSPAHNLAFNEGEITVVAKCKLTGYFSPDWDSNEFTGPLLKKGAYVKQADGTYKITLVQKRKGLITSLLPLNEGVAVTGDNHEAVRLHEAAPVEGFLYFTYTDDKGKKGVKGYPYVPDMTPEPAYCDGKKWMTASTAARWKGSSEIWQCSDRLFVPSENGDVNPQVRTVDDKGGFKSDDNNNQRKRHLDLWFGAGDEKLKIQVNAFKKERTCLRFKRK